MELFAAGYAILVVIVYAAISGLWVESNSVWYRSLKRPPWQPPNFLFGLIWPYNFFVLGLAGVLVSLNAELNESLLWLVTLSVSVIFALAWSWDFYKNKKLMRASIWLGLTALTTLGLLISISSLYPPMFWWLVPYQLWLITATSLSTGYAVLNSK